MQNAGGSMNRKAAGILVLSTLMLSGCIFAPSGSGDWERSSRARPTIGQELLDLDRAREAGVITTAEYERTRARILERQ